MGGELVDHLIPDPVGGSQVQRNVVNMNDKVIKSKHIATSCKYVIDLQLAGCMQLEHDRHQQAHYGGRPQILLKSSVLCTNNLNIFIDSICILFLIFRAAGIPDAVVEPNRHQLL